MNRIITLLLAFSFLTLTLVGCSSSAEVEIVDSADSSSYIEESNSQERMPSNSGERPEGEGMMPNSGERPEGEGMPSNSGERPEGEGMPSNSGERPEGEGMMPNNEDASSNNDEA